MATRKTTFIWDMSLVCLKAKSLSNIIRFSIILLFFILASCDASEVEQERKSCEERAYREYNEARRNVEKLKPSLSYQLSLIHI